MAQVGQSRSPDILLLLTVLKKHGISGDAVITVFVFLLD